MNSQTDHNKRWLEYQDDNNFPRDEFWTLTLEWMHTEDPKPARLEELQKMRNDLMERFTAAEKNRRR